MEGGVFLKGILEVEKNINFFVISMVFSFYPHLRLSIQKDGAKIVVRNQEGKKDQRNLKITYKQQN